MVDTRGDVAVRLKGVSKSYGTQRALDDVNLVVAPGNVHALVGLNGAGKTTMLRILLGMVKADSGSVTIRGRNVERMIAAEWNGVGHLIETPFAYPELTVHANIRVAARLSGVGKGEVAEAVDSIIDELKLDAWAGQRMRSLSLGNRQRVGLAAALVGQVNIAILDEPANSLDPAGVVLVREAIRRRAEGGAAVLVSSHHLDEVARVATDITVINGGRVVGTLDPVGIDLERQFFALVEADTESAAARVVVEQNLTEPRKAST